MAAWQDLALTGIILRVQQRGWLIREWLFSHDVAKRDLSVAGVGGQAERREEQVRWLHLPYRIAPKCSVTEGLDAVRRCFPKFRFARTATTTLVEAVGQYQRAWDPEARVYAEKPKHTEASHFADSPRTFAVAYTPRRRREGPLEKAKLDFSPFTVGRAADGAARAVQQTDGRPSSWRS